MGTIGAAVSHDQREIAELQADRELGMEYLKIAMEELENPEERAGALLALCARSKAYGGLSAVITEAKVSGKMPVSATRYSQDTDQ